MTRPVLPTRAMISPRATCLAVAHQIHLIVRVDRNDFAAVADNNHIAVSSQLIAVDDFAMLDSADRRPLGRGDVDTVVKTRAARTKSRIERAAHRPQKCARFAVGLRDTSRHHPVSRRDDFDGNLPRCSWNKYLLANDNLARVSDAVGARQDIGCRVVGFTDAK